LPDGYSHGTAARAAPGTIERKYPHIVELAVGEHGLDVGLGRQIMHFHNSRHIKPRHGHRILKDGQMYYRWCFLDPATAHAFIEQFSGSSSLLSVSTAWMSD